MPSIQKTGYAYIIFGVIIIIIPILTKVPGWKGYLAIAIGAILTLAGLYMTSKKK
jgi:hypothetical protein